MIGGHPTATDVEAATIGSNGLLQTFSADVGVTFVTERSGHTSEVIGGYVYVIGGENSSSFLNSIERAPINGDGSLGKFATVPGVTLAVAREIHTSVVIGNHLYVLGGFGNTSDSSNRNLNSVEEATINADGSLGTFAVTGTLANGRGHTSVVVGNYLYVIGGGAGIGGGILNSVERATIGADGLLWTFAAIAG